MANRVYISGKVKDELQIKQIRNILWTRTKAREFYHKKDPHLTIVPAFGVKESDVENVRSVVDGIDFTGEQLEVNTLCLYENVHKPYVVQLDVQHNMQDKINTLIQELDQYSTNSISHPASLHITLFKTQGWWETVPREMKKRLQDEVMLSQLPDTEISDVKVDVK